MGNYEQLKSEVSNGTHPRTYNGVTCLAKKNVAIYFIE